MQEAVIIPLAAIFRITKVSVRIIALDDGIHTSCGSSRESSAGEVDTVGAEFSI